VKRIFVDASAFLAFFNRRDENHARSSIVFQVAMAESWRLVTTNVCLYEAHAGIIKRVKPHAHQVALRFLEAIPKLCTSIFIEPVQHRRAETLLRSHRDKRFSFSDALSFVVMQEQGLSEAFAYDEDFRRYGRFVLVQ
jgi:uncharacterized protein